MTDAEEKDFKREFDRSVADVFRHWTPEMQAQIARHNSAWAGFDFRIYLESSISRYRLPYDLVRKLAKDAEICDLGGFWGVYPLTLRRLGVKIAMTEALKYYDQCFTALFNYLQKEGVEVLDYDPFEPNDGLNRKFDFIHCMAVLEHYPHSLKLFMRNVRSLLKQGAAFYVEVPNVAYWPKRVAMLKGVSPLSSIDTIYTSETPFVGHHHEFTQADLRRLMELGGFRIDQEFAYNYSSGFNGLSGIVPRVLMRLYPTMRECLSVICHSEVVGGRNGR
jgi:2-polyprenyl-3-methyl-5-hydroxy-6-metoxy-1,4-benzoquinol methylase